MKKWFKKTVAVVLTAAMAMSVGMPAFAAENTSEREKFYITDVTTLGDIVEYTNPEGYAQMPTETRERLDATNAKECMNNACNESSTYMVNDENVASTRALPLLGNLTKQTGNYGYTSFSYSCAVAMSRECPYVYLEAILYDHETNELIQSDYKSGYDVKLLTLTKDATGLESGHWYRLFVFADIIPPSDVITMKPFEPLTEVLRTL